MSETEFIVIGYALLEGGETAEYMHSSVTSPVFAPSKCVCTFHPSYKSLTWVESDSDYTSSLQLSETDLIEYRLEVDGLFNDNVWGFDSVFVSFLSHKDFKAVGLQAIRS